MGTIRKYGLLLIVILATLFIVSLPDFILKFIPSPTGNPLDMIFLILIVAIIFLFWKG